MSLIQKIQDRKIMLKFMMELCNFEFGNALLEFGCFADSMVGPDSAVLLAVLSGLGRRSTHPASWLHLSFRGH